MASFFEKLKRGMGIEIPAEDGVEIEKPVEKKLKPVGQKRKLKKLTINTKSTEPTIERVEVPKVEKEKWFEPEGQLAIDVYQTETELVIQSAIAGVKPENLDISIEEDQVLIKGSREKPPEEGERNYFYQECYWGPFSRQIILPEEVDPSRTEAEMKEGILTIRIPKIERKKKRKIVVKG